MSLSQNWLSYDQSRLFLKAREWIDDKSYHAILEAVFRVVKVDSSQLARATKYTVSKISARLSTCASLVRTIVEVGLRKLRSRSVKAIVDHIIQSLPTSDGDYCEPLLIDYFKALSTLLSYHAHVDHLNTDDWHELTGFCIQVTGDLNKAAYSPESENSIFIESNGLRKRPVMPASVSSERSNGLSKTNSQSLAFPQMQGSNEDVLMCLKLAISTSSAPVMEQAESILEVILLLLRSYPHLAKIHQTCYEVVEHIMARTIVNDITMSLKLLNDLIPLIQRSWQRATFAQRESMLAIILQGQILLPSLLRSTTHLDVRVHLEALLETMRVQYCGRKGREQLLLEDIDLTDIESQAFLESPLSLKAASIRLGVFKAEEPWCVVYACSSIYAALEEDAKVRLEKEDESRKHVKRRKMNRWSEDLLDFVQIAQNQTRLYAIQTVAFVFDRQHFEDSSLTRILETLMSQLTNDDVTMMSWAIFAIMRRNYKLISYLLQNDDSPLAQASDQSQLVRAKSFKQDSNSRRSPHTELLDSFLESLTHEASLAWDNFFNDSSLLIKTVNADTIYIILQICVVGYGLLAIMPPQHTHQSLVRILNQIQHGLKTSLLVHEKRKEYLDVFYECIGSIINNVTPATSRDDPLAKGVTQVARGLDWKFWESIRSELSRANGAPREVDFMDLDDEFDSQATQTASQKTRIPSFIHDEIEAKTGFDAFKAYVTARLCWISTGNEPENGERVFEITNSTSVIEYLTSLKRQDFVLCGGILEELLSPETTVAEDEADTILQYIQQVVIKPYEMEKSEVATGICINALAALVPMWTANDGGDLATTAAELYLWFLNKLKEAASLPATCLISAARLLRQVVNNRPELEESSTNKQKSARTLLFEVFRDSGLIVKYEVMGDVSQIFGRFVLQAHEKILEDVIDKLPSDPDWAEGIALRLKILGTLAATWPTLLRRCLYSVFETAAMVRTSIKHASTVLVDVSRTLNLSDSKELFKLFAPQIIYTWTDPEGVNEMLEAMPFAIFGYSDLKDLLIDVHGEVVGQMTMRGKDEEMTYLSKTLSEPFAQLLTNSFAEAAAYCIARDISLPQGENPEAYAEARLRKLLGKGHYKILATKHFAEIIAIFFLRADQEYKIDKAFQRDADYANASTAYQEIILMSQPSESVPVNLQPSFSSKYLLAQIDHLCGRTFTKSDTMWVAPLYVYVFRKMMNSIHTALGSLYACAVLRRIRILITIVGHIALEGYPLEMTLHSVRPFLTDTRCANDAIGLVQYLLEHSAAYTKKVPLFLLGFSVSTLISMKSFLATSQDSTTQESQFKAIIENSQRFREWLISFLLSYTSPELTNESFQSFQKIIQAISSIRQNGSARRGTPEGDLLMTFLDDQRSGRNLIPHSGRRDILSFLGASFKRPADFHEDILGDDQEASSFASVVLNTCRDSLATIDYHLWSGRVLGRSFARQGLTGQIVNADTKLKPAQKELTGGVSSDPSNSRARLLSILSQLLTRENLFEVGLAEMALNYIVTESQGTSSASECQKYLGKNLVIAMTCTQYEIPNVTILRRYQPTQISLDEVSVPDGSCDASNWLRTLVVALTQINPSDPLMTAFAHLLSSVRGLAEETFPLILHSTLLAERGGPMITSAKFSEIARRLFDQGASDQINVQIIKFLLDAILYLRTQPLPHETVKADRLRWLDIDFRQASIAASRCSMHKTALMFVEVAMSEKARLEASTRRRSKALQESADISNRLLTQIYEQLDEQYEQAGFKSLSFRGAFYDCQIRRSDNVINVDLESMVRVLNNMDLNGLSQPLVNKVVEGGPRSIEAALSTARKLEQWDIVPPKADTGNSSIIFDVFRKINNARDCFTITAALDAGFAKAMSQLCDETATGASFRSVMSSLAALTEAEEVFSAQGPEQLQEIVLKFSSRDELLQLQSYDHIKDIISCRETAFSTLSKRQGLQQLLNTPLRDSRLMECRVLLASAALSRTHGALQNALTSATYLDQLVEPCQAIGLDITAASQVESAHILWSQGEKEPSVRLLEDLIQNLDKNTRQSQSIPVGKPELLAKLGHHTAEARLEKPDYILQNLLKTAVKELKGEKTGHEAGEVFHEFASFCDQQLQNPDSFADFQRIKELRERKETEVRDLDRMIKSVGSQAKEKDNLLSHRNKAQQWFNLDDGEYRRLESSRQTLLRHSLENYLLSLQASDGHENDTLRFSALWLENADNDAANEAVAKYMPQVPSRKFARLMNQWTSRLLAKQDYFQSLLFEIILRVCIDHPYHGMYQIFASSKTRGGKDDVALARHKAANNVVDQLKSNSRASRTWLSLHNMNVTFVRFAQDRVEDAKPGSKVYLRKLQTGQRVEQDVLKTQIPPPTMDVELRADCDYSHVTTIAKFQPEFSLASGISMPKIVTAIGTDGLKYKQLFKSGHDDLRQDAIMEQVFGAVSSLLGTHQATRQRDLKIRAYKVLPLTATAGVIEFVSNTVPLHDYLLPAHQRHFPKDLKPNACRKHLQDAQSTNTENRVRTFRKVCEQFHPVLHYFFQERFESPDEWFEKRLAYTRSTAAISILGHILGLGDRHGHNILLDEKTGEVVHIDLGIAFEQGRVLPVPEVVPFRLTRDLVDGMGITGTEGVFRRCCEFTLEALRNESYAIMTILDVLRYDPLYSWSLSPLRLKKMQEAQTEHPGPPVEGAEGVGKNGGRKLVRLRGP
ncbi:uncharacterized protein KY384_004882 [Bacidia gigantensis]|uniref:uncharacterized protein n=1 Tax=Bacidia gigantensis TaxID=2732470 RepID=UPI001D058711|nr:uncharacterized protein KY384_004882 [Bacidia gigantensis]KAG8530380.1 hypothetical protein KY384_004882 [Bacidia gigantensis]